MPKWREILRAIYGPRDEEGERLVQDVYLEFTKGSAKTTMAAGICLFELLEAKTTGFETYSAGCGKKQAANLYRAAEQMIVASSDLSRRLYPISSAMKIVKIDDPTSFYEALSSESKIQDGTVPGVVVRDEVHEWTESKMLALNEILERSAIKRKSPLVIDITTAGIPGKSNLCWARHEYTRKIEKGVIVNRRFFGRIFCANERKMREDPFYWTTRQARVEANLAHEDNGGYMKDEKLATKVVEAQQNPAKKGPCLRYHFGYWGADDDSVVDIDQWRLCAGGVDLSEPGCFYDFEILVRKWGLVGQECFLGIDIGVVKDLTALAAIFPPPITYETDPEKLALQRKKWIILMWYWMPKASVLIRKEKDKVQYDDWVDRGFITAVDTKRTDPRVLIGAVERCREMFDLRNVAYDPANAYWVINDIEQKLNIPTFEVPQYTSHLNGPTKWLLENYLDSTWPASAAGDALIVHGNHPVLMWNASNLALERDKAHNVKPIKASDEEPRRIDGISAIVTGLRVALADREQYVAYDGLESVKT